MKKIFLVAFSVFVFIGTYAQWPALINPYSSSTYSSFICSDNSGNIYSAGYTFASVGEKYNFILVKQNSDGEILWTQTYDRNGEEDKIEKILIDTDENIIVIGTSFSVQNKEDIVCLKYNPSGELLNTYIYNGSANLTDKAIDVVQDKFGNYYINGTSRIVSQRAFVLIKLDIDFNYQWSKIHTLYYGADSKKMSYNPINNSIAIVGYHTDWENLYLLGLAVFDSEGEKLWHSSYRMTDDRSAVGTFVHLNNDGSVIVCGYERNIESNKMDALLMKFNSSGEIEWKDIIEAGNNTFKFFKSMVTDDYGNIYVTGDSDNKVITAKYNQEGTQLWLKEHNGNGSSSTEDAKESIQLTPDGSLLVLGRNFSDSGTSTMVIKYSTDGEHLWSKYFSESPTQMDEPISFTTDQNSYSYVLVNSRNENSYIGMAVVRFSPYSQHIADNSFSNFSYIYPNPTSGSININLNIGINPKLEIYSSSGQKLFQTFNITEGETINTNLHNGIYLMKYSDDEKRVSSRLIIQK